LSEEAFFKGYQGFPELLFLTFGQKQQISNANQFEKSSPGNSLLPSEAPLSSLASGIVLLLDPVFPLLYTLPMKSRFYHKKIGRM